MAKMQGNSLAKAAMWLRTGIGTGYKSRNPFCGVGHTWLAGDPRGEEVAAGHVNTMA